jgi:nucleoside-diphosphate-sugar epimerase
LRYNQLFITNYLPAQLHRYDVVIHLGAHTETDLEPSEQSYRNNFLHTKHLVDGLTPNKKLIFASSASVYGNPIDLNFSERVFGLKPENFYAYTKLECDRYIHSHNHNNNIYSLRFFNVYGARERHKVDKNMCSPIYKWLTGGYTKENKITILTIPNNTTSTHKFERDFVYVEDVCKVIYHCMTNSNKVGDIYNVGTGISVDWKTVAETVLRANNYENIDDFITYRDFNTHMSSTGYQYYTRANLDKLRNKLNYTEPFNDIVSGVTKTKQELKYV